MFNPVRIWKGLAAGIVVGVSTFATQSFGLDIPPALQSAILGLLVGGAVEVRGSRK